ncbi:T9SS type A sorting domain-containing protein [Hymenobacter negativus]|uniref:T9SS type A sorting domain-containing protein n=1 Tax=Hymenobacter negativus TaxID=2795026 RepID=A0ABS0Q965_9BACT|nr:T9SS type A sorting domain-containing protein [Hymenobacter negativus]MBH8559222.1 T9SS type A sorting domain-containing protein [Hymenobacter negativus]
MLTNLQSRLKRAGRLLPFALLPFAAHAQLGYSSANAVNTAGTYTDLGTTGTVIATSSTDDANSAAQPLGFTFTFNGTAFTDFVLNTNGYVKLGTAAPSAATQINPIGSADPLDINIVAPLSNIDLQTSATATAEYRVFTSGTAGSRVTTIQWKNVADKLSASAPAQFASMQFQLKFYETSNRIEFVYGTWVAGTGTATGQPFLVGLKGTTNGLADRLLGSKTSSATAWTTTTFTPGTVATTLPTHFVRNTFPPDAGRTYRFLPTSANDAGVVNIQTLGTVSSTYGSPVTVSASIRNAGSNALTALPVTLTVAGATTFTNTQTVASLAAGASTTVTFTAYPVTTAGVNTLTVSVPADDNATNNSATYSQTVTAASQGYVDTTQPFASTAVGIGAANGVLAVKYSTSTAAAVTSITPTFTGAGSGATTYQLQVYAAAATGPGALLYTSATLTRPTVTGPVATAIPNIPVTGSFYVAIKELDNNLGLGNQVEDPLRAGTFFFTTTGGTTWNDISATTLKTRLALDVTLGAPASCGTATALTTTGITSTAASVGFTAPSGATSYTVTYTPTGGPATTVTPAPTASPIVLSGLSPGTTYTVSIITNCAAGQTSSAATTTFTTLPTAPANDDCANAIALTVGTTCTNTLGTNQGATASTSPIPAPSCGGPALGPLADVWYTVTVPASGNVAVTTSAATGSPVDDTVIEIYSGTCGALTSLGCNDDNPAGTDGFSALSVTGQTAGAVLYVRVRSYNATATGQFNICVTNPVTLANDNPSGAITLPLAATCTPTNGTNVGATTTTVSGYVNPGCGIAANPKDVWFKFTTAASGVGSTSVNITVTGAPAGQVRVFSAASAAGPFTSVGCAAGTTNNTVAAPLRVDGLTPSTTYYVFVSGYGSNDTQGAFTICAVGLAPLATPTYVTLPYTEGFEATWADDALATRDIPTVNWRNTPATGNNSWRREDDGFATLSGSSANWSYPDNEQPTTAFPTPPYVTRSSVGSHSARFHSFGAVDTTIPGKLDLYANLSGTGNKQLSFDFINPSGTDKVEVFVSTDGGLTFGATPVLTATTSTTFTNKTVTIASTSATTVIRFQATSDYGNDDMGIDNLRLAVVTATQNAALAATVNLYPNPAHQSFQLSVPTSLRAASASLSNTLGQVVQSRQLNLPAAGGTADFNVSSLAPGVYTLTLKSGTDLVVKRVVVE